jgi:hypothetical protein
MTSNFVSKRIVGLRAEWYLSQPLSPKAAKATEALCIAVASDCGDLSQGAARFRGRAYQKRKANRRGSPSRNL